MANQVVNRQVTVYINSGEASKAYDLLIKKEKALNDELAKTSDPKRIKALQAALERLKDPIDLAAKKMRGELQPTIRDLQQSIKKLVAEYERTGSPELLRKIQALNGAYKEQKSIINGLDDSNKALTRGGIFTASFWANLTASGVQRATMAIGNLFQGAIQEALDADAATRRLESTLDNLGQSDVFDRLTRKAQQVADKFRYLDNDDVVGVFNKLIDYGKLTEGEMDKLLPVIINFAAKSRISLEESTNTIVKALEGNGKALKQYGINIKDASSETDRFNIVLNTLGEKVDGAGDAFQNSVAGGLATARQRFADLKEELGNNLLPILNKILSVATAVVNALSFKSPVSGYQKALLANPAVQSDAIRQQALIEQQYKDQLDLAKKYNKNAADITNEFISTLKKRKADLESQLPGAAVRNVFTPGKTSEDRQKVISTGLDIAANYTAVVAVLDKLEATNKKLGIAGNETLDKTAEKTEHLKTKVDLLAQAYKQLHELNLKAEKSILAHDKEELKTIEAKMKAAMKYIEFYFKEVSTKKEADGIIGNDPAERIRRFDAERLAKLEFTVLTTRGKKKLEAEKALLKERERQELDNAELTESQKAVIEEKYRQLRKNAELEYFQGFVQQVANYVNQVLTIFSVIGEANTNRENAELERDRRLNDAKKSNLDKRLKRGLITELQYRQEIDKMDREQDKKEREIRIKQFNRKKREQLAASIINTAEAVTEALPNLPLAIIVGALGLAQTISIGSQKPPEFAAGGRLGGQSHAAGGNAVIDGSGRKIAEVEAGEGIVNKRTMAEKRSFTVSGTPSQIASTINGLYGTTWESGGTIMPAWRSYRPAYMNFNGMRRTYANGGVFNAGSGGSEPFDISIFENITAVLSGLQSTLASIQAEGIMAYSILTQTEKEQARLDAIRKEATIKG